MESLESKTHNGHSNMQQDHQTMMTLSNQVSRAELENLSLEKPLNDQKVQEPLQPLIDTLHPKIIALKANMRKFVNTMPLSNKGERHISILG